MNEKNDQRVNEITIQLTDEEVKSLDTLAWQEEQRLGLTLLNKDPSSGRGLKVRAAVVRKIRKATA